MCTLKTCFSFLGVRGFERDFACRAINFGLGALRQRAAIEPLSDISRPRALIVAGKATKDDLFHLVKR
jgi:hypothetical protein